MGTAQDREGKGRAMEREREAKYQEKQRIKVRTCRQERQAIYERERCRHARNHSSTQAKGQKKTHQTPRQEQTEEEHKPQAPVHRWIILGNTNRIPPSIYSMNSFNPQNSPRKEKQWF